VLQVVILTLREPDNGHHACDCGDGTCATASKETPVRVPVRACADALRTGGAGVELVTACSDAEIDDAVKPVEAGEARLVIAASTDAEVRGVVRRIVRRYAPPPSKRPADLPPDRTVFDLPPLAILPMSPAVPALVPALGLPATPDAVAAAVLGGAERRLDLLRTDAGSVTLHGGLLAGLVGPPDRAATFRGRIEVDDAVLSDGSERLLACAVVNAGRSEVDGLPLVPGAIADDGLVEVAVAVPVVRRRLLREASVRIEVRRARGRAMSVTPHEDTIALTDDGVRGELTRKRSWWTERNAWSVYVT
jgi:hypothetical protein